MWPNAPTHSNVVGEGSNVVGDGTNVAQHKLVQSKMLRGQAYTATANPHVYAHTHVHSGEHQSCLPNCMATQ